MLSANVTQVTSYRTTCVVDWERPTPPTDVIVEMSYSQFSFAGVVELSPGDRERPMTIYAGNPAQTVKQRVIQTFEGKKNQTPSEQIQMEKEEFLNYWNTRGVYLENN